jgi:hypothetical protein
MNEKLPSSAPALELELQWFRRVLDTRMKLYFGQESEFGDIFDIPSSEVESDSSGWTNLRNYYQLSGAERLAILLALVPHVAPQLLDVFFTKNVQFDRPFSEFGGRTDTHHSGFLPTGETLLFLLSAGQFNNRFKVMVMFRDDHFFSTENILYLDHTYSYDPPLSGVLTLSKETLALLIHGEQHPPGFSANFPAKRINTNLEWSDLIIHPQTRRQMTEVETWLQHGDTLLDDWGMRGKIRSGFRAFFHGPPGTGKTLTACLLGKAAGRDVYSIDLSMIISRYIGETEKNLEKVFRRAEREDWILLFDEADALFEKHSEGTTSQVVAYLLQRIEDFSGVAILTSSTNNAADTDFARHFEAIIPFPLPNAENRLRIWQQGIPEKATLAPEVDLGQLARQFELSQHAIMSVIRYASLEALRQGGQTITLQSINQGIRKELQKTGKAISP